MARRIVSGFGIALVGALISCTPVESESPTVVIVNNRPITQSEVDARWSELSESRRAFYLSQGGKKRFLDEVVLTHILLQEADRLGLPHTPAVQERMERMREQVLLDAVKRELIQTLPDVSEADLKTYAETHAASALEVQQVRVAVIVVPAEAQARDVKRQIDQGYDFGRLAQKYSTDEASRAKGGDIGLFHKGAVPADLESALLNLKPGQATEPIAGPNGYYIVKVVSRLPPDGAEALAAAQRLRQELLAEKRSKQFQEALAKLKASASVRLADVTALTMDNAGATSSAK
jgi:peptidyl-prolyl cis-trans isomerase C